MYRKSLAEYIEANRNRIYELYVQQEQSLHDVADATSFPGGFQALWKFLKKRGWSRSVKQAKRTSTSKEKTKTTHMAKYGSPHNFCREHPSRKEWEESLRQVEGICNVFQRKDVKAKIRETMLAKYGVSNPGVLPRIGRKIFSRPHQFVVSVLEWFLDERLTLEKELPIDLASSYYFDIHVNKTNLLVEVNGNYWHGNPTIYKATDIVLHGTSKSQTVKEIWDKDEKKRQHAERAGYKVYVIWEQALEKDAKTACIQLLNWIGENDASCKNQINHKDWPTQEVRYNRRKQSQLFCERHIDPQQ